MTLATLIYAARGAVRSTAMRSMRTYATTAAAKQPSRVAIVAQLRKATECSIAKAREAIAATDGSYSAAAEWIAHDAARAGAVRAAKVATRVAAEGAVATSRVPASRNLPPTIEALVELNCETDFAARNPLFLVLAQDIAFTARFFADIMAPHQRSNFVVDIPLDIILKAPLVPRDVTTESNLTKEDNTNNTNGSVHDAILRVVGKLGENIQLRRVVVVNSNVVRGNDNVGYGASFLGTYIHGAASPKECPAAGQIASAVVLTAAKKMDTLDPTIITACNAFATKIAQQVAGFEPLVVDSTELNEDEVTQGALVAGESRDEYLDRVVLLRQPFLFGGGSVLDALGKVNAENGDIGLRIASFERWKCGEGIEKKKDDFAEEVRKQASS